MADRVREFQQRTLAKVSELKCPIHKESPKVQFNGHDLRDMTITMRGCCNRLLATANKAIAS